MRLFWALTLALPAVVLAACSGDKASSKRQEPEGPGPKPEFTDFCVRGLETETYPALGVDLSKLSAPEQVQVAKAYASGLAAQAERFREVAPEQVRADVNIVVDGIVRLRDTGDLKVLDEDRVVTSHHRVHAFELENCGWARQDVTAVDYGYRGVRESLAGGPTSFELKNEGKETHELVLFKINDNVKDSLDQLLSLPRDQLGVRVTNVGSASAKPGEQSFVVADLSPGRYAMACFLPVGGAAEGPAGEGSDGPPHFSRGMRAEFRVS